MLTRDGIDNPPLRFADEFVRHKILDLIGDLALFGKRILGYVKADRAGHAMHTAIVSRILRDQSYWEEVTLDEAIAARVSRRTSRDRGLASKPHGFTAHADSSFIFCHPSPTLVGGGICVSSHAGLCQQLAALPPVLDKHEVAGGFVQLREE